MVVQPRRLAARMLSKQVAKISGWSLGKEVGYQVRFDACCSEKTRILYVTDGIAEKKLLTGEGLDDVEVIILDEFHERSAQIDLCLSLALAIWEKSRQNLRIFVTSATLDLNLLENFIPQSISIELSQRSYPVEIDYSGPRKEKFFWKEVVRILPGILTKHTGDILIFMDGAYEISRAIDLILKSSWSRGVDVFPLYGDLSPELQDQALAKSKKRKILLSTNIAETSLTVEGIKVVIDSGRVKKLIYDSTRGLNRLVSEPICQSAAQQRAGRAGRTSPGYCLRLWSEKDNQARPEFDIPEICRIDLSQIYLNLMGFSLSFKDLKLIDSIPEGKIEKARQSLRALGAIDQNNSLSDHGKKN